MTTDTGTSELARRLDKLYEFEREPVTADRLQSGWRYPGLFAGEHVAATEFVIGVLFVQWGASARDLIWGLILGNALAVLSWAFICAPIAVDVRLTLYWYVRRIIGPGLTVVYNFVNALLYCCLAAAMIGVSASAVIIALRYLGMHIDHPQLQDVYPNSAGWVLVVLAVGAVVVALAVMGFKALSQFSTLCSPWMFIVFIAGALASLPKLGDVHSAADVWRLAETKIWTGRPYEAYVGPAPADQPAAQPGGLHIKLNPDGKPGLYRVLPKLGFWHIVFFAWFCNLAMHVGLSDMALFRYAKHWYYGFHSAFGMYLGHFLAWICAGVMGAAFGGGLQPGPMADAAVGPAGLIAVLLAGWTTANPTIYRAGLALQIITPNWPRWKVTVVAGAITTVVALFPAIFMRMLDFVAIYGLMLMPIGAIVVVEHWLFPRLGWMRYWTEHNKRAVNPAALISWVLVLVLSFPIEDFTGGRLRSPMECMGLHLFFRWLPGWFIAAGSYLLLAPLFGARQRIAPGDTPSHALHAPALPTVAQPTASRGVAYWLTGGLALAALAGCLILPFQALAGTQAAMADFKVRYMIATVIYFVAATVWLARRKP